jgi:hypothetical protein
MPGRRACETENKKWGERGASIGLFSDDALDLAWSATTRWIVCRRNSTTERMRWPRTTRCDPQPARRRGGDSSHRQPNGTSYEWRRRRWSAAHERKRVNKIKEKQRDDDDDDDDARR